MPYASVQYPSSTRPYTFYTDNEDMNPNEPVLVKDKKGFSICRFVGYVKKPSFPCNVVIASKLEMDEKARGVQESMDLELAIEGGKHGAP